MEHFASLITHFMYKHKYVEKSQMEWLHYAIVHRGMNSFTFILLFLEGTVLIGWKGSLLFTGTFRFLRTRTGGYHAKTPFQCCIASFSMTCVSLEAAQFVTSATLIVILMVLSGLTTIIIAPSNNKKIHLSQAEISAIRPRIVFRTVLIFILGTLMIFSSIHLASCVTVAFLDVSVLLLLAHLVKE